MHILTVCYIKVVATFLAGLNEDTPGYWPGVWMMGNHLRLGTCSDNVGYMTIYILLMRCWDIS